MAHEPFEPSIAGSQGFPPYECSNVKIFAFSLPARVRPLQEVCDQFLNLAPEITGRFAPNPPDDDIRVALEVAVYESIEVPTPQWHTFGKIRQQELLFYVPVTRTKPNNTIEEGIFISHIFVDDQGSAFTGREVLGMPKMLADFHINPFFPDAGTTIEMRLKGRNAINEPVGFCPVVKIEPSSRRREPRSTDRPNRRFEGQIESFRNPDCSEKSAGTSRVIPGFSSRILSNPEERDKDSYQSIMRYEFHMGHSIFSSLPPAKITLRPLGLLDIARRLGIETNGKGEVESSVRVTTTDFDLLKITTLWQTCEPTPRRMRPPPLPPPIGAP
jgi:hypothetical protein